VSRSTLKRRGHVLDAACPRPATSHPDCVHLHLHTTAHQTQFCSEFGGTHVRREAQHRPVAHSCGANCGSAKHACPWTASVSAQACSRKYHVPMHAQFLNATALLAARARFLNQIASLFAGQAQLICLTLNSEYVRSYGVLVSSFNDACVLVCERVLANQRVRFSAATKAHSWMHPSIDELHLIATLSALFPTTTLSLAR
jgi:hypothetical protein